MIAFEIRGHSVVNSKICILVVNSSLKSKYFQLLGGGIKIKIGRLSWVIQMGPK